jgi:hypothetical protein
VSTPPFFNRVVDRCIAQQVDVGKNSFRSRGEIVEARR